LTVSPVNQVVAAGCGLLASVPNPYRARAGSNPGVNAEEMKMPRQLRWLLVLSPVILAAVGYVGSIQATPALLFTASTISKGRLEEFDVNHHLVGEKPADGNSKREVWMSQQRTKGPSDLYVQSNLWRVGGTTGWHTHPGHSLVTVTAGAVTNYDGDDPTCTGKVYTVGMTFVDHGGDHAHLVRNEGFVDATTTAVQLIPADAIRRVDVAEGNSACPF
jgi:hypothetical protein